MEDVIPCHSLNVILTLKVWTFFDFLAIVGSSESTSVGKTTTDLSNIILLFYFKIAKHTIRYVCCLNKS